MKCRRPNAFLLVMGCGASKGRGVRRRGRSAPGRRRARSTRRCERCWRTSGTTGGYRGAVPDRHQRPGQELHGLTLLHHDRDFDVIVVVTGQPARRGWFLPSLNAPWCSKHVFMARRHEISRRLPRSSGLPVTGYTIIAYRSLARRRPRGPYSLLC
jgi:hypothetical protein